MKAARRASSVPAVGTLVKLRYGTSDVLATVIEDRGPLGVGGRPLVRVSLLLEGVADAVETEAPVEDLTVVALPDDPATKRVSAEAVGGRWVGTYTNPDGRVAVVTDEMESEERARAAALRWVRTGLTESRGRRAPNEEEPAYRWRPDPRYPGRYSVYRQGRLGLRLAREHA